MSRMKEEKRIKLLFLGFNAVILAVALLADYAILVQLPYGGQWTLWVAAALVSAVAAVFTSKLAVIPAALIPFVYPLVTPHPLLLAAAVMVFSTRLLVAHLLICFIYVLISVKR